MKSQTSELLDLYVAVSLNWTRVYGDAQSLFAKIKTGGEEAGDLADYALLLKRTSAKLDDSRKECNRVLEMIEKQACLMAVASGQGGAIRGEICVATPKPGQAPPSFKRDDDPEKHDKIMKYFGFSQEAAESGLARLHYPNVEAHLQQLMADGKPLPEVLKGVVMRPTFGLTCRCASGVDIEELALNRSKELVTTNQEKVDEHRPTTNQPGFSSEDIPF